MIQEKIPEFGSCHGELENREPPPPPPLLLPLPDSDLRASHIEKESQQRSCVIRETVPSTSTHDTRQLRDVPHTSAQQTHKTAVKRVTHRIYVSCYDIIIQIIT